MAVYSLPPVIQCVELASRRAAIKARGSMERGLTSLASIAATASFVGFFGTVVAIISSFKSIGTSRSTALGAITGGVSEAMAAGILGLFVAVIAFWFYRFLCEQLEGFEVEMESETVHLVNRLVHHLARLRITDPAGWAALTRVRMDSANQIENLDHYLSREPRFDLPRMYRHGILELLWPKLESGIDAELALDAAAWICLAYAVIGGFAYWNQNRSLTAVIILVLFSVAGVAVRGGSVKATLSICVVLFVASVTGIFSYGLNINALCCLAAMVPLVGSLKASRWLAGSRAVGTRGLMVQQLLLAALVAGACVAVLFGTVFGLYVTPSNDNSMHPTIDAGDWLVGVTSTMTGTIRRSELIEVNWGDLGTVRVIGLPGDQVQIRAGRLMLNGRTILEPYCNPYSDAKGDFPLPSEAYADEFQRRLYEWVYRGGIDREAAYIVPAAITLF